MTITGWFNFDEIISDQIFHDVSTEIKWNKYLVYIQQQSDLLSTVTLVILKVRPRSTAHQGLLVPPSVVCVQLVDWNRWVFLKQIDKYVVSFILQLFIIRCGRLLILVGPQIVNPMQHLTQRLSSTSIMSIFAIR